MHTAIVGGGMAGMAAAIAAAEDGQRVTVLERGRKPLKKLGATGNGRGNLLNAGAPAYYGDAAFAQSVLARMPYARLQAFWQALGVPLAAEDEGRVYPASFMASAAVDALLLRLLQLKVDVIPNTRVTALRREGAGFVLTGLTARYAPEGQRKSGKPKPGALLDETPMELHADRVIVAAGGAAAPMYGTDGTAYPLLTAFGHALAEPRPALCALCTQTEPLSGLSGQRVRAALALCAPDGRVLHKSRGEALFAADGVSGIAAMQLARFVEPGCTLHLDLRPGVLGDAEADACAWLRARVEARGECPLSQLLTGAATPALGTALLRAAGLEGAMQQPARRVLDGKALLRLADTLADWTLAVTGVRGFEAAQVTAGGVETDGFDPATMQSRLCPGLYAAGEILNVDGDCGGYNLMFALASGLIAGAGR